MQDIKKTITQRFTKRKLDKQLIGSIALTSVKDFFSYTTTIEGYLKYNTLFITTNDHHLKIQLFLQKEKILTTINEKIHYLYPEFSISKIMTK